MREQRIPALFADRLGLGERTGLPPLVGTGLGILRGERLSATGRGVVAVKKNAYIVASESTERTARGLNAKCQLLTADSRILSLP